MNRRQTVGVLALLSALAVPSLSGCSDVVKIPEDPRHVFAYVTSNRLVLHHGPYEAARIPVTPRWSAVPTFTDDGRFVFIVSDVSVVLAVDVVRLTAREFACACASAAPLKGSRIGWLSDGNRLMQVDLDVTDPVPDPLGVEAPDAIDGLDVEPHVLAGAGGRLLMDSPVSPSAYGGPVDVYLVIPDRGPVRVGSTGGNMSISFAAGTTRRFGGGPAFAITAGERTVSGDADTPACEELSLAVIDANTGGVDRTIPKLPKAAGTTTVATDLWWGVKGDLYLSLATSPCYGPTASTKVARSILRLSDSQWTIADDGSLLTMRAFLDGVRLTVSNPSDDLGGTLHLEDGKVSHKIAADVHRIAVSPLG